MKYNKCILLKEMEDTSIINTFTEGNSNFAQKVNSLCEWGLVGYMYCVHTYVLDIYRRKSQKY